MKLSHKEAKITLVYTTRISTFVQRDIDSLRKKFDVSPRLAASSRNMVEIIRDLRRSDISVLWFATMSTAIVAILSKILRKPTVLIIGGADVASLPEFNYGLLTRPFYRIFPILAIRFASLVLVVDEGLREDIYNNTSIRRDDIQVLPTGYDPEEYKIGDSKENIVLTVCSGSDMTRLRIKGVDIFIEVARAVPDTKFIVVGLFGEVVGDIMRSKPDNLIILNEMDKDDVISYYQKAKVYCQLSKREGLPNALCEAMLCEGVPVGSDVQGVRTAIGDMGFLAPYGDIEKTTVAVKKALDSDIGPKARQRIIDNYHIDIRQKKLKEILENLLNDKKRKQHL